MNSYHITAQKGFKLVTGTTVVNAKFYAIITLASTVIDEIEFPTTLLPAYSGDAAIEGATLPANLELPIWGDSIQLTSGSVLLLLR